MKNAIVLLALIFTANSNAQVGIGTTSPDVSASLDVSSTTRGFLPPRMTHLERNAIEYPSSGLMIWCTDCGVFGQIEVFNGYTWTNMIGGPSDIAIGDTMQGGVIAYFLEPGDPGYVAGQEHGLIAAPGDQSSGKEWGCWGTYIPTSTAIGSGQANTTAIVNMCGDTAFAAKLCNNLVLNGYSDWYLPSKSELDKLFQNKATIGGFSNGIYWSSSDISDVFAFQQSFSDGYQNYTPKYNTYYVRAIHSF